ncbi:putative membrane protein [Catenulispora sp. GP43]|uniref:DUF1622 domain-containing protein n=1 Tax=Catenulispora sp. GP43 TaxID=3156263 RepID=UPI003513C830
MTYTAFMEHCAQAFEFVGAVVLAVGLATALVLAAVTWRRTSDGGKAFRLLRGFFGGALLLSLEILVAADLLRTVAVSPTLEEAGVLAIIVLIRTFLSFSLEIEIEGVVPWRRATMSGATVARQSIARAKPQNHERDGRP